MLPAWYLNFASHLDMLLFCLADGDLVVDALCYYTHVRVFLLETFCPQNVFVESIIRYCVRRERFPSGFVELLCGTSCARKRARALMSLR